MYTICTDSSLQSPIKEELLSIRYIKKINTVAISGRSTGLEVVPAYSNLINQIESHFLESSKLKCYFHFSVINASTTKALFKIFRQLVNAQAKGNLVDVFWVINEGDQELIDVGLDFKNLYDINFHITVK